MLDAFCKRPADHLDYDFDFSRWLSDGDRIDEASATLSGVSASITSVTHSQTMARVWIDGGQTGQTGQVAVIVKTVQGRQKEVVAQLRITEA